MQGSEMNYFCLKQGPPPPTRWAKSVYILFIQSSVKPKTLDM